MSITGPVVTTLVVGVPSAAAAVASYIFSIHAHREAAATSKNKVDADAYLRAKELYESAISELRLEIERLKTELHDMREQITTLEVANEELQKRLRRDGGYTGSPAPGTGKDPGET